MQAFKSYLSRSRLFETRSIYLLWAAFVITVVIVKLDTLPTVGNVFNVYCEAGRHLLAQEPIYQSERFLYLPTAAVIFSPFSLLPFAAGGAIWRVINLVVFISGIVALTQSRYELKSKAFAFASITTMAIGWSAARHGQATLAMAGLMMLACVELQNQSWWRAGLYMALAVAFKPLAIVLFLSAIAVYPRTAIPALTSLCALCGFPFLIFDSQYLLQQYIDYPELLGAAVDRSQGDHFYQLFWMLKSISIEVGNPGQLFIRSVLALVTLFLVFRLSKKSDAPALLIFTLNSCYILLLGSGTENNTYSMIIPVLGLVLYEAVQTKNIRMQLAMAGLFLVCLVNRPIEELFLGTLLEYPRPLAIILLTLSVIYSGNHRALKSR